MITAHAALQRLKDGNARFASDTIVNEVDTSPARRAQLASGQAPFAVIMGCSDSRVPAELVFDQGLGDLFVIRVAGQVVAPSQIGSVEYAAAQFGTRLVVVMGHTDCGAVAATLDELRQPSEQRSPNLRAIVDRIRPAVEGLLDTELRDDRPALMRHAVRANIRACTGHLRHGSRLLEELIEGDGLLVVSAEYNLDTGVVTFFES